MLKITIRIISVERGEIPVTDNKISTEKMSKEILLKIFEMVNQGTNIEFEEDMGEGTVTIYCGDRHTHCGFPNATDDELIESIYNTLIEGRGLSFDIPLKNKDDK